MRINTIGFTKKKAEKFFELIKNSNTKCVIDVRLNNVSQLAGFSKKDDLKFFLKELCGVGYEHFPDLAPTKEMLDAYKKDHKSWQRYENEFLELMSKRQIESNLPKDVINYGCLLCSEDNPHHCHRKLVAEYLKEHWDSVEVIHLQ